MLKGIAICIRLRTRAARGLWRESQLLRDAVPLESLPGLLCLPLSGLAVIGLRGQVPHSELEANTVFEMEHHWREQK